jgi:hypothetical protein
MILRTCGSALSHWSEGFPLPGIETQNKSEKTKKNIAMY